MSKQTYAKAKGRSFEADVVEFLRALGIPAERRRQTGAQDCGDIGAWPLVVVEAKACKAMDLAGWSDELAEEVKNSDARFGAGFPHVGVIFAKRRGRSAVKDAYAIMPTGLAVAALKALLEKSP